MYIKLLNYLDTFNAVIFELYGVRHKNNLTMQQNLDAVEETYKRMREYVQAQKDQLTQS